MQRSLCRFLFAAFIAPVLFAFAPAPTQASEWGCTVLLCLAAPGNPPHECDPPLEKLWEHLREGGDFPACEGVEGAGPQVMTQRGSEPYLPCRAGYNLGRIQRDSAGRLWSQMACVSQTPTGQRRDGTLAYDSHPAPRRAEPNWIEVVIDGQGQGRVWW